MGDIQIVWPAKTRELSDAFMDSTVWNDVRYRDGDIVIATYGRAGTTWMQQIVAQILFGGADVPISELSPWVEFKHFPREVTLAQIEGQKNRRFLKTHLPVDSLVFSPQAKYICIGRDGRDVIWSYHAFHMKFVEMTAAATGREPDDGLAGPPPVNPDIRAYYHEWLDKDGYPFHPFFAYIQSWWDIRRLPNVMLSHYNQLKADLPGEMRRVADFLGVDVDEAQWPSFIEHCSFGYMKGKAEAVAPMGAAFLKGGKTEFFHKGTNGRWRDMLTPAEAKKYEDMAAARLSPDCAHWLATGELDE